MPEGAEEVLKPVLLIRESCAESGTLTGTCSACLSDLHIMSTSCVACGKFVGEYNMTPHDVDLRNGLPVVSFEATGLPEDARPPRMTQVI